MVVCGVSGSGVHAVGGLVSRGLGAQDSLRGKVGRVQIDLAGIAATIAATDGFGADTSSSAVSISAFTRMSSLIQTIITEAFSSLDPSLSEKCMSVVVVILTTTPDLQLPQADLLKLLVSTVEKGSVEGEGGSSFAVSLSAVVAVASPKSLLSENTLPLEWYGETSCPYRL